MRRRIIEGKIGILCATLCATLFLFQDPAYAQVRYDTFFVKPLPAGGLVAVSGQASVCLGTGLTVASGSITSNVATLVMSSNPLSSGFINGRDILVINFSGGAAFLNGSYTLTQVTSTQIQFAVTHGDVGSLGTGGVLMKPASNAACAPLANVFSDQGLTVSLNPFFSDDGKGNVGFWAVPGTYFLTYYSSGLNPIPVNQITIPCPASGCAFTGPTTAAKLNNVFRVDGVTYPFSTAGLQAAIAAAIAAGGGIVDARGMGSFNITSEIDVGNHAQVPVTLLLPQAATWTVSGITNGTSCAIKQFSQSSILGPGTGGSSAMVISAGAATNNLDSLYCTEAAPTGNGSYIRAEGFQLSNPLTATMANGAMNVQALFDDSEFKNIVVASYGTVGLNAHGLICCGTNFTNLTSNGNHVANSIPVQVTLSTSSEISFYNLSADHPGVNKNAILISGVGNGQALHFYNVYSEGNNTDTTTANVSAGSTAGPIDFFGIVCNDNGLSTAFCVDIPNSGTPNVNVFGMQQIVGGSANCLNDHYAGKTYACLSGNLPLFANRGIQPGASTVAQLPAASVNNAGQMRVVTDSTAIAAEGQTCAGSSTNTALAFSSGAAWKCF